MEHIATVMPRTIEPQAYSNSATPSGSKHLPTTATNSAVVDEWAGVVACIADAYPTTAYAKMDAAGIHATATAWRRAMGDVPLHGVTQLYDRVMARHTSTFAPTLGDFKAAWQEWETFWLDTNGEGAEAADAPVLLALLAGPVDAERVGPGLRAARLQMARVHDGLTMVCCGCANEFGNPTPAVLTSDGEMWCCGCGGCDFRLAVVDTDSYQPRRLVTPPAASDAESGSGIAPPNETPRIGAARLMFTDLQIVAALRQHGMVVDDARVTAGEDGPQVIPPRAGSVRFDRAVRFGRRLETMLMPHLWSRDVLRAMWLMWEAK